MAFDYNGWYVFVKPFGDVWHAQKCGVELTGNSQKEIKDKIKAYGR